MEDDATQPDPGAATISDPVAAALVDRGVPERVIGKILRENVLRVFDEA